MKIFTEINLRNFESWSGATGTQQTILDHGKEKEFDSLIEELYPDGIGETHLNDILWFEHEWIFEMLGIEEE